MKGDRDKQKQQTETEMRDRYKQIDKRTKTIDLREIKTNKEMQQNSKETKRQLRRQKTLSKIY